MLENYKLIREAIERHEKIECIIVEESKFSKYSNILETIQNDVLIVPENVFSKVCDTVTSQGIIAVIHKNDNISVQSVNGRVLVLDRIQDAGNVGTLMRSSLGFGFDHVVLIDSADPYSPKVIRSCGGSVFKLKIAECSEKELINAIRKNNHTVFTADMNGTNMYDMKSFPNSMMLIIGNEGQGVSGALEEASTNNIMIPMKNDLESLNAGVSGSIIMSYIHSKNC